MDSAAEARPEGRSLDRGGVGEGLGRGGGEDADKLGLVVIREMYICDLGGEQSVGWWVCEDEDGCQRRDLGA